MSSFDSIIRCPTISFPFNFQFLLQNELVSPHSLLLFILASYSLLVYFIDAIGGDALEFQLNCNSIVSRLATVMV